MVAQVSESTTFGWVPYKQFSEMKTEKPAVMRLWYECWECDPYGSRWMKMTTHLTGKTLKEAKARIRGLGLFEFKSEVSLNEEGIRHWQMYVINLQGSKSTGAIKTPTSNRTGVKNYPTRGEELPHMGQNSTLHGAENYPSNPSEIQGGQGLQQSSLSINDLKESTTVSESGAAAVFSSLVLEEESISSPTNSPDNQSTSSQTPPPENLSNEIQHLFPAKLSVIQTTPVTQISVLNDNPLSGQKSSAPAARHITSQSNQDAPQATPPRQTSNPTLDQFEAALDAFSLELEPSLENLLSALKDLGRLSEFKDVLGLKDLIRSKPTQVAVDAIDHVVEKLSSIKVLGAYMRKALNDSYKPTGDKVGVRTVNVSREEPKPAPEALEEFLSEEVLERFRRANLAGQYLQMCEFRLKEYWQCGDSKHEQIIDVMRQMQKNNLPFVSV